MYNGSVQSFKISKTMFWRDRVFLRVIAGVLAFGLIISLARPAQAAIAFRSASSADNATGATSVTITAPTGATVGDVLIATIDFRAATASYSANSPGWTVQQLTFANGLIKNTFSIVLTSTPPSSYVFNLVDTGDVPFSAKATMGMLAYSGVSNSNPVTVSAQVSNAASLTATAPSVTTTLNNSLVVALYGAPTATTATQGSSFTERYDVQSSGGGGATGKSTSAGQDAVQAVAGVSGTKIMTWAASTFSIGHTVALTPAPLLTQAAYRWFANSTTAGTVGSPLANQDTTAVAPVAGQPFRLRMLLGVTEQQLPASTAFKLQYKLDPSGACSATGSYSDVTASTAIRYYDNAGVLDAAAIVTSANDPVRSGVTKVTQTYEELNNFSVATAVPVSQDGMWDFALMFSASADTLGTYCLKTVYSNGTDISSYTTIASIKALAPSSKIVGGNYRFSQNANSLTPGSPLAVTDTAATLATANDAFRLRATAKGYQGYSQIFTNDRTACGIGSDNQAYCWGEDASGELGNGATTGNQPSPVPLDTSGVLAGKTILSISMGTTHTCALASDNFAYCWGADDQGQLGNGVTTGTQTSPVAVDTSGVLAGKTILSIEAGGTETCAIASDNLAYCWGLDNLGQLGNGAATTLPQTSPVAVDTSGVLSGKTIVSIKIASASVCAIASDNLAYCWGNDTNGQLGNGATTGNQVSPVAVDVTGVLAGKTILSISAGQSHTCAIASDNKAYCWGDDQFGQLGNGATTGDQVSPVAVDATGVLAGKTILSISAGQSHTCAIASDSRAYCWGSNFRGELGNNPATSHQSSPVAVDASGIFLNKTILKISTSFNSTCAIASDNQAYCWGMDPEGQVGNGPSSSSDQTSPVAVTTGGALSGKTIQSLSGRSDHTCVIASDIQAYCWGSDAVGQLGNGTITGTQVSPVAVDTTGVLTGKTILSISAGNGSTCAIASDNKVYCWGDDTNGQLGNGATTGTQVSPVAVDTTGVLAGKTILSISAGSYHTCAIASDNKAYCWGFDGSGQLGNGVTATDQVSPVAVDTTGVLAGKTILSISAGISHTCAIASDNKAYCWGSDANGQIGNGVTTGNQVSPVAVDTSGVLSGKTILSITAGTSHTCAIASDNKAYCWGSDANGQIGNGAATSADQVSPVAVDTTGVLAGKTISSMSAGGNSTCAIASDNLAYCWGEDFYGRLGNGTTTGDQVSPVAVDTSGVLAGKTFISISGGDSHTCVITSDNLAYCWGSDASGRLGNGTTTGDQVSPIAVALSIVNRSPITTSRLSLSLQYAQKTLSTCLVQTGFAAITTSTSIAFNDNAGATSSTGIALLGTSDPVTSSYTRPQTYHDIVDTVTNINDLIDEASGLWDFSLKDNGAPASTTYCLRLAGSDGTALGMYNAYPEVTTSSGGAFVDPQGGLLRGGQAVVNGIKNLFSW